MMTQKVPTAHTEAASVQALDTSDAALPCSLAQQRFWFLEKFNPGNPSLNVAVRWQLRGAVTDAAVEYAFHQLIARHEILRTRFIDRDGEPHQVVMPALHVKITHVDLRRLTPEQRNAEHDAIGLREAQRPFDLETGPPVRLAMLRLDETAVVILLTMHHIATDGWTMGILSREFGVLVSDAVSGGSTALPEIAMQFADYALWQSDMVAGGSFAADADYWRTTLYDMPRFEVMPDKPRPQVLGTSGDFRLRNPPPSLMDAVEALARRQGQTMYSLAATALAMALAAESGAADIVMGTQVAGRDDVLLEPIAGLFINTLVLRFNLHSAKSARDANEICRRAVDGALAHQRYPFEKLVETLNPSRDSSRTPLFSVNFTLIRPVVQSETFPGVELVSLPSQLTGAQYDLLFFMVKRDDGWRMVCESSRSLYEVSTPDRILGRWEQAFKQLLETPDARLFAPAAVPTSATSGSVQHADAPAHEIDAATLEDKVVAIWRELLGRHDVSAQSHFFEHGGHSLLALRMLARVGRVTGKPVPVAVLFQNPVLADFVAVIGGASSVPVDAEIARIQPLGALPPVIVINDGAVYHAVAQHIGLGRPTIDINLAYAGGSFERAHETLEGYGEMAVRLIKRAQPYGPYTLMGHCVLGTVAFEAAQQLRRAGDTVSLVLLLDVLAPGYVESMPAHDRALRRFVLLGNSWRDLKEWKAKVKTGEITWADALFQYGFMRRSGALAALQKLRIVGTPQQTAQDFTENIFTNHLLDVRRTYQVQAYDGDVVQFRAETARNGRLFDKGFGWGRWMTGRYDVVQVPSDHLNMMREPAAAIIGREVNRRLLEIEARADVQ
jgi:thioesterase domain-containing protein